MLTRIEQIMAHVRGHPAFRREIPFEAAISLPIPRVIGDQVTLQFLVHLRGRPQPGTLPEVFCPYILLGVDYATGRLVQYLDLRTQEGGPASAREPLGPSQPPAAAEEGAAGYMEKRHELLVLYPEIVHFFCHAEVTGEEEGVRKRFIGLFQAVTEPALLPHYERLNPAFFSWLRSGLKSGSE